MGTLAYRRLSRSGTPKTAPAGAVRQKSTPDAPIISEKRATRTKGRLTTDQGCECPPESSFGVLLSG